MPPPSIPLLPKEQASDFTKYKNRLNFSTADAWKSCADAIEQHDADECKAHREEIDTLLVFAGLFSAVLTAFAIESYQWLQDDPNDAIIALLSQLVEPPGSTHATPSPTGLPDAVSVRINAYWFLSLTLSLSAALVAILCKQWVREFERHSNQSHRQYIGIRQMKLEGFQGWGVASIVMAIPLLLQGALGLFALGLIELLWNLHSSVALVVLVPTAAALLFYALTSLLPGLQDMYFRIRPSSTLPQCPFKSPQSTLALRVIAWLGAFTRQSYDAIACLFSLCLSGSYTAGSMLCILFRCPDSAVHLRDLSEDHMKAPHDFYKNLRISRGPYYSESWSALDAKFNKARDSYDYPARFVLPPSHFRGLKWLRDHIDQPGMTLKMCLAAWDIVTTAENGAYTAHPPSRLCYGLSSLSYTPIKSPACLGVAPIACALEYAKGVGFHHDFLVELIIQHAARMDALSVFIIFEDNVISLDEETQHALLRAILVRGGEIPNIRNVLLIATRFFNTSMSRQELACVISVYLQALYSGREDESEDRHRLQDLFVISARCVEVGDGTDPDDSVARCPAEVNTALCALVLEIDRRLGYLRADGALTPDADYYFARGLVAQTAHRDIYVRLLASAPNGSITPPGDISAAEIRFEQTVVRLARKGQENRMRWETGRVKSSMLPNAALHVITADPTEDIHAPSQLEDADQAPGQFRVPDVHKTDHPGGTDV